ncbi:hypothetical protein BN7_6285 [Wickerhamomyces ciferrii]|uniref:ATPase expression protein 1 n=1 Tax=Wickerhamomyces ciferrii (strain ATCC 14091 / BCRC 22168 / CBS 111 / JCM 3599 / NBRC 0793 / NRRL Y-1031 F-60-10) TaxID=1206466 RepID=K0KZW4_WICCF|nr:uncharacterized protein BN7_6285 [Wickerhamomyces ciferrii]CCH46688.1 hypothetical protein BN7_6285 [Wickerhamomyces ciferrii]
MSNTIKQTVHKGSKSLDFISHNLRASIVKPLSSQEEAINVPDRNFKERIKTQDVYCNAYYRPNGIDKLIKTIEPDMVNRTGALQSFIISTDSKPTVEKKIRFDSERQAITYFKNIPKQYQTLNTIEFEKIVTNLSNESQTQLSEIYDGTSQSLDNILALDLNNTDDSKVNNKDKILYVIQNLLDTTNISVLEEVTRFITTYTINIESPSESKDITINFLNQIINQNYKLDSYPSILGFLTNFKEQLFSKYKILNKDAQVLDSWAKTYIHFDDYENTKHFMDNCINTGFTPSSNTLKSYISLTQEKHESKKIPKFQYFSSLIGLDDAIHTQLDGELTNELLKRSNSPEEIISLIQALKNKYQDDELKNEIIKIKPFIQNYLTTHIPTLDDDPAIKTTIHKEFEELSGEFLNEEILYTLRRNGNFILAQKQLQKMEKVDKSFGIRIMNTALTRILEADIGRPGFDKKSRDAFVQSIKLKMAESNSQ